MAEGLDTSAMPSPVHFKDADFVGGTETIFNTTQQAISMVAFAFEVEHGVGDVFKRSWASDGAFFGDMANDKNRCECVFRELH